MVKKATKFYKKMAKINITLLVALLIIPIVSASGIPIDTLSGVEKDQAIAEKNSLELTAKIVDWIKKIGGYVSPSHPFQGAAILLGAIFLIIFLFIRYNDWLEVRIRKPLQKPKRIKYLDDLN